jgi:NAD(P)-dependent dehydrogenase (short-subunit alcohol dehydrogenase family)
VALPTSPPPHHHPPLHATKKHPTKTGLGLELARQLLTPARGYDRVFATCRSPGDAAALATLASASCGRLSVLRLDVEDPRSIEAAAAEVGASTDHVDLLLNAAGVLHVPGLMSPETALTRLTPEALSKCFAVNAAGPILVARAFTPLLAASERVAGASDARPAVLASISARVGSIADNGLGGWYSYRASKTALNQLMKTASIEFKRKRMKVATLVLHPGTCETDLSAPFRANVPPGKLFSVERGAAQLLDVVGRATLADTGRFFAWDGTEVPW